MSEESIKSVSDEFCSELSKLLNLFHCSICLNLMVKPVMTRCFHRFCCECIERSIQSSGDCFQCPQCYEQISDTSLKDHSELNDVIVKFSDTFNVLKNDQNVSKLLNNMTLISRNDSTIGQNNDNNCNENKENDESIVDRNINELQSNLQKSLISIDSDELFSSWPSIDSLNYDNTGNDNNNSSIEEVAETQHQTNIVINENLRNSPINLTTDQKQSNESTERVNDKNASNVAKINTKQSLVQSNDSSQLKTQDLIVNRSSVSYGLQPKPNSRSNQIFDKIISKSRNTNYSPKKTLKPLNSNRKRKLENKVNKRCNPLIEDESDIKLDSAKYAKDLVAPISKQKQQNQTSISVTNPLPTNVNENKNPIKKIRNIDSSEVEMVKNDTKHKLVIKNVELREENQEVCENEFNDMSDDELMFSIHSNDSFSYNKMNDSSNNVLADVSIQNDTISDDSSHGFSSPILFDGFI